MYQGRHTSFRRFIMSFYYAGKGFVSVLVHQQNMLIHLIATAVVIFAALFFSISLTEWCILLFAIGLVWVAELLNTAIEAVVDLVHPDYHPLAGRAKDIAAAAVLASAVIAAFMGILVFSKHIF